TARRSCQSPRAAAPGRPKIPSGSAGRRGRPIAGTHPPSTAASRPAGLDPETALPSVGGWGLGDWELGTGGVGAWGLGTRNHDECAAVCAPAESQSPVPNQATLASTVIAIVPRYT